MERVKLKRPRAHTEGRKGERVWVTGVGPKKAKRPQPWGLHTRLVGVRPGMGSSRRGLDRWQLWSRCWVSCPSMRYAEVRRAHLCRKALGWRCRSAHSSHMLVCDEYSRGGAGWRPAALDTSWPGAAGRAAGGGREVERKPGGVTGSQGKGVGGGVSYVKCGQDVSKMSTEKQRWD